MFATPSENSSSLILLVCYLNPYKIFPCSNGTEEETSDKTTENPEYAGNQQLIV